MIDLNRTSSIGVAGLKRFLEYAEKGTRNTPGSSFPLFIGRNGIYRKYHSGQTTLFRIYRTYGHRMFWL